MASVSLYDVHKYTVGDHVPHALAPSSGKEMEALRYPTRRFDEQANLAAAGYSGSSSARKQKLSSAESPALWGESPEHHIESRLVEIFYSDQNVINVCDAIHVQCERSLGPQCPPREDFVIGRIDALTSGFHDVAHAFHGYRPTVANLQMMNRECVRRVTEVFIPQTVRFETQQAIRKDPFQFIRAAKMQPIDQDTVNRWRAREAVQKPMGETISHPMDAIFGTRGIESFDQLRAFKQVLQKSSRICK